MKRLKTPLTVRGDSLYCPLAFSLDSYGNCLTDCWHCYLRNLNAIWGEELKPVDLDILARQLHNGPLNRNPRTPVAHCLAQKKTIRWGNKADPFQTAERQHRLAPVIFDMLYQHQWTFVIQTMHTDVLMDYLPHIERTNRAELITVMPIISPGMDRDWETLERKRTNAPTERLRDAAKLNRLGIPVGINGEPFIPGYHTVKEFSDTLQALKAAGIHRYNTYNLHLNPFVAKRLHAIGLDIERIWRMNQDDEWRPIQRRLCDLAQRYEIILGCPDFVNTGRDFKQLSNTCCGVDVPNPTTFNTHFWKRLLQSGESPKNILQATWDGVGDRQQGKDIVCGRESNFYTMKDAGF